MRRQFHTVFLREEFTLQSKYQVDDAQGTDPTCAISVEGRTIAVATVGGTGFTGYDIVASVARLAATLPPPAEIAASIADELETALARFRAVPARLG